MGVVDRFEKAVSQGINAPFSRIFSGTIKAVDVCDGVKEHLEQNASQLSDGRIVVPNEFKAILNSEELEQLINSNSSQFVFEMVKEVTDFAAEQDYVFVGPVEIKLASNATITKGTLRIESAVRRGPAAPVTNAQASPKHPILDIEGQQWLLTEPITVIGRGSEADIVVIDPGVSRRHLEIRITPKGVIATDLGSTNGTYVEGHRIEAATLLDGNELTIGRTTILFWTSPDDGSGF